MTLAPLKLGWIDFGSRDRNKILAVLQMLSGPEAVDELGIGVVRDGFSDVLFPGTSTVQTRAKYLLIVPYILMELEQQRGLTYQAFLEKLRRMELDLIPQLKVGNPLGVIGGVAGEKLLRRPSSIYWNALYIYGIFNPYTTRLSIEGYAKAVCAKKREKERLYSSGRNRSEEDQDDSSLPADNCVDEFWRVPPPVADWRNSVAISLTPEEAVFLKERIIESKHSRESLLAFLLRTNQTQAVEYDRVELIESIQTLPDNIRADLSMAQRFMQFVYGANIRYNMILSGGQNKAAAEEWSLWYNTMMENKAVKDYDINEPFERLQIYGRNRARLLPFLRRWRECVLAGQEDGMDRLLIQREIELKGKDRAKLNNSAVFRWQEGIWLGGGRLQYRFGNARQLLRDIFTGIQGGQHA